MKNGLAVFRKKAKDWMVNPDGEPHCPDCWPKYLSQFSEDDKQAVQKDSKLLAFIVLGHQHGAAKRVKVEAAQARRNYRSPDGWLVMCEKCGKSVLVPYSVGETN